jgi:hypothetical protein
LIQRNLNLIVHITQKMMSMKQLKNLVEYPNFAISFVVQMPVKGICFSSIFWEAFGKRGGAWWSVVECSGV